MREGRISGKGGEINKRRGKKKSRLKRGKQEKKKSDKKSEREGKIRRTINKGDGRSSEKGTGTGGREKEGEDRGSSQEREMIRKKIEVYL